MAKFYKNPFAYNGDYEPIADGTQSSGKVSNEDGFTSDYELLKSDPNYRPVGRKEMNGIFNEITGAIHQIQTQGAAEFVQWFKGYKKGAFVRNNGNLYLLTSDSYNEEEQPAYEPSTWLRLDILTENKTVTVESGGDFSDLVGAIDYARALIVRGSFKGNPRLEIKILSGYELGIYDQILLDGEDLGFVDITSESTISINPVNTLRSPLEPGCKPVFGAKNGGVLPVIKAKFQFIANTDREKHGVAVLSGAKAVIGTGGGFLNTPGASLYADGLGSEIVAAEGYDASNSYYGIFASNGAKVQADGIIADSCGLCAIEAKGGATVYARNATLTNSDSYALRASGGAQVWVDNSSLSGFDYGIYCEHAARVLANNASISSTVHSTIYAGGGGKVYARSVNIANTTEAKGIIAEYGGEIIVDGAEIISSSNFTFEANAAKISANGANVQMVFPDSIEYQVVVRRGGEIRLYGAALENLEAGDEEFFLSQSPNLWTQHGFICVDES